MFRPVSRPATLNLAAASVSMLIASTTLASETRTETLNDTGGISDVTDVFLYPGAVTAFDLALIELGTRSDTQVYGGALKDLGAGSAGIVVSRQESLMTGNLSPAVSLVDEWLTKAASNTEDNSIIPTPERPIDLFYGGKLGGKKSWGLRLTYASFQSKGKNTDGPTNSYSAKADQLDLHLGFTVDGANRMDVGLAVGIIGTLEAETETENSEVEHSFKRGTPVRVSFRHLLGERRGAFYEAIVGIRSPKVKADDGSGTESGEFKETGISLEGGYRLAPNDKTTAVLSVVALYMKSEGPIIVDGTGVQANANEAAKPSILDDDKGEKEVERTTTALYSLIGVESGKVWEGLGFMGGLQYALWGTIKEEDSFRAGEPESERSITETPDSSLWSLGLFYEADRLRADASLNKRFLHNGPDFVSGEAVGGALFMRLSATYLL